jgi:hypothetical protein
MEPKLIGEIYSIGGQIITIEIKIDNRPPQRWKVKAKEFRNFLVYHNLR